MNPLILARLGIAALVFFAGFGSAWYIQGLRLTAAQQELVDWQQAQVKAVQSARDYEYAQNVEAQNAWSKNLDELRRTWRNGWVPKLPGSGGTGFSLPTPGGTDGPREDAVSVAGRLAEDCSETTLQLNQLQQRVESQRGY